MYNDGYKIIPRARAIIKQLEVDLGEFDDSSIPGLCPEEDSCEQCRAARRAHKPYMAHVYQSWAIRRLRETCNTFSDLESRADPGKEGQVQQGFKQRFNEQLEAYKEKYG